MNLTDRINTSILSAEVLTKLIAAAESNAAESNQLVQIILIDILEDAVAITQKLNNLTMAMKSEEPTSNKEQSKTIEFNDYLSCIDFNARKPNKNR